MSKKNILIVEDEESIRNMVKFSFFNSKFVLKEAEGIKQARKKLAAKKPDLILLDWMLPDGNGINFAKELRATKKTSKIPIIMLTAKSEMNDKIQGFDAGADDYIVKPFSTKELIARIKAILRHSDKVEEKVIKVGDLILNIESHRVSYSGNKVTLGPIEYKLLVHFMTHANRIFSRSQLLNKVWDDGQNHGERTVDVHITRLRKALENFNQDTLIQTIRGSGYKFSLEK